RNFLRNILLKVITMSEWKDFESVKYFLMNDYTFEMEEIIFDDKGVSLESYTDIGESFILKVTGAYSVLFVEIVDAWCMDDTTGFYNKDTVDELLTLYCSVRLWVTEHDTSSVQTIGSIQCQFLFNLLKFVDTLKLKLFGEHDNLMWYDGVK